MVLVIVMKANSLSSYLLLVALTCFATSSVIYAAAPTGDDLLHEVDQLHKSARIAVLTNGSLQIVDVAQPEEDVVRLQLDDNRAWELLGSSDAGIYYSDGGVIYCLDSSGESRSVVVVNGSISVFGKPYMGRPAPPFRHSTRSEALYFPIEKPGGRDLFTHDLFKVSRGGKPAGSVPLPGECPLKSFDYDLGSETVYIIDGMSIVARKWSDPEQRRLRMSEEFDYCELSPDGRMLLLFNSGLSERNNISVIDVRSGAERSLSARGSDATWASNGSIVFLEELGTTLSRENIKSGDAERLVSHVCKRTVDLPSPHPAASPFAMQEMIERSPKVSADGRLVCWAYASDKSIGAAGKHTVIADLVRREYVVVNEAWWHAVWFCD